MRIVDYVVNRLSQEPFAPERERLGCNAKAMTDFFMPFLGLASGALLAASAGITGDTTGELSLDTRKLCGVASSILILSAPDLNTISRNISEMAFSDTLWRANNTAKALFKDTFFAGKLLSRWVTSSISRAVVLKSVRSS
jgi:hypothetical protein